MHSLENLFTQIIDLPEKLIVFIATGFEHQFLFFP
jgi:hypothetical protein